MSMDYVRRCYGVPAKRGGRVRFRPGGPCGAREQLGTIAGARGQYLRVRVDTQRRPLLVHPTWMIDYLVGEVWVRGESPEQEAARP